MSKLKKFDEKKKPRGMVVVTCPFFFKDNDDEF